jgi:hypothetical protein
MRTLLLIGGVTFEVRGSAQVREAVAARYRPFVTGRRGARPVRLFVGQGASFRPEFERPAAAELMPVSPGRVALSGGAIGELDLRDRTGFVEGVNGLGPIDALLRAALSLVLPGEGALLVHAAVVPSPNGGAWVLAGAPGAGKSTAAARLGGVCDELAVVRATGGGVARVESTPYWAGVPFSGSLAGLVVLERGASGDLEMATGGAAVRALAPHVVRYAAIEPVERQVFEQLVRVCALVDVRRARCPEGGAFMPFLARALALGRAA